MRWTITQCSKSQYEDGELFHIFLTDDSHRQVQGTGPTWADALNVAFTSIASGVHDEPIDYELVPEDFLHFFKYKFQQDLELASIPGMPNASWDRRAAWLLWNALEDKEQPEPSPTTGVAIDFD